MRRAIAGLIGPLAAVTALAAAGCDISAYCFSGCGEGAAGGGAEGGGTGEGGSTGSFTTTTESGMGGNMDCGDTQSTLENCGACGKKCELAGAIPQCLEGQCIIQACLEGQYDIDGNPANGCEYSCPVPNPIATELCDGIDNDCDSLIDADDTDLAIPPNLCNLTPGTPCEATQVVCDSGGWTCNYPATVEVTPQGFVVTTESLCDGIDGNCDGDIDEWFVELGTVCEDAGIGPCKDYGLVVCDPTDAHLTSCDLSAPPDPGVATAEACDGVDNDCNGFVDDALPASAFDMVPVPAGGGVLVDAYEASRPDASNLAPGIVEAVACSKPMVLPWTGGGYSEAAAACAARGAGYRLCTLSELTQSCRGDLNTDYPYGNAYQDATCNGVDQGAGAALATGALASCVSSPAPIHDLSGNVAEWTATQTNVAAQPDRIFALSGGSYLSPEHGLECSIDLTPRALETTLLPNIGFRCCFGP
ncbi:MAG: SUMF1/EgtB/PvdO family nonheme iron enzyme [Polyangiaceae bacterium]|nr:SUMF1/EgtB/PvdO family nonheme iron enzyme [Polyangiaceae bacterium]